MPCLLVRVRFHEARYHGRSQEGAEWPPSAARLFQALVAGAARGQTLAEDDRSGLAWLESLDPPVIAAPPVRAGQGFRNFVPDNDLDAVGGDPKRVSEIRAPKLIRPLLFQAETPLLYLWTFDDNPGAKANAKRVCEIAEQVYQFGRGVDMAWARGEIIALEAAEALLVTHGGVVYRPSDLGGATLAIPIKGSLASVIERHEQMRRRFQTTAAGLTFSQPRKPRFQAVPYNSPPVHLLFDLRASGDRSGERDSAPWPLVRAAELVTMIRDRAAASLAKYIPENRAIIECVLIGRGASEADKAARVRIVPLPSVGHAHADRLIRRVLVEILPNCPIRRDDLEWAFSGLDLGADYRTDEVMDETGPVLTAQADRGMLRHYGIEPYRPARVWRTVTPVALPQAAARRAHRPRPALRSCPVEGSARANSGAEPRCLGRHSGAAPRWNQGRRCRRPRPA